MMKEQLLSYEFVSQIIQIIIYIMDLLTKNMFVCLRIFWIDCLWWQKLLCFSNNIAADEEEIVKIYEEVKEIINMPKEARTCK